MLSVARVWQFDFGQNQEVVVVVVVVAGGAGGGGGGNTWGGWVLEGG